MNRHDFITNVKRAIKRVWKPEVKPDIYIGVDWGGREEATSICTLSVAKSDMNVEHRHLTNMDIQDQINVINEMIAQHNPKSVVVDFGYGQAQTQELQSRHGDLVKSCYYAVRPEDRNRVSYNVGTWMLSVDRAAFMNESRLLAGPLEDNDQNSLNYAYIAWSTKNTRSAHENPIRTV